MSRSAVVAVAPREGPVPVALVVMRRLARIGAVADAMCRPASDGDGVILPVSGGAHLP